MNTELRKKLRAVTIAIFDFDGVMTDGTVWVSQDGHESVRVSRKDGLGIEMLKAAGIEVAVLSKETNAVVAARCQKLGIACHQGVGDKARYLNRILVARLGQVLYMGDDINDLECMKLVGISITVADGHPDCKRIAAYVTSRNGGDHAVREVCDLILSREK